MYAEYPDLIKTALASDAYWAVSFSEITADSTLGLFADSLALKNRTSLTRDGETASRISSIVEAPGEDMVVEPVSWGEKVPDMHLRQVIMAVEDSRVLMNKFSPSYLAYKAGRAMVKKQTEAVLGMEPEEPSFEDSLENFYDGEGFQYSVEAVVDYSSSHIAIIRRSILFMKRNEEGELLAAPGVIDLHPDLWKVVNLSKMPDIEIGGTYSRHRYGSLNHIAKIIEAQVVEPRHVTWKDQQRPKGKRHKRRLPRLGKALPGKIAASQA